MADLTPKTRSESFLNGEDLEPITRREHFYAGRENDLPEGHQEPETREEWFIKKYREAGDVTVESLSITENGTYTAPSGKAYSPVSVNVPLPSNAYLLKSIEHEQVATFTDGTDNFLKSLEIAIEPIQSGSGEPSPTNIRPISGWDEVNVVDDAVYGGLINWNQLAKADKSTVTQLGVTFTNNNDGSWTLTGTPSGNNTFYNLNNPQNGDLTIKPNHVYFMSAKSNKSKVGFSVQAENASGFQTAYIYTDDICHKAPNFNVIENTKTWARLQVKDYANVDIGTVKVTPQIFDLTQMFGSTIADEIYAMEQAQSGSGIAYFKSLFYKDYYPYNSGEITNVSAVNGDTDKYSTITIDLDGTRYGGKVDVVNGVLTLTDGFISSYNGETLPSTWISDRDVYVEGTTPTIGAEVCYKLATPQTIQLTPTIIKSLQGENNLFASTGEIIKLEYLGKEA